MTKHLFILTGASRGMGLAMAEQLLNANHFVLCISRNINASLTQQATRSGTAIEQCPLDLEHSIEAATALQKWLTAYQADNFTSATLINNAGVIPDIKPLSTSNPAGLARALRVGLEAPMLLTAAFLGVTQNWDIPLKVLNISSGLGRRAMASQSAYCAAKAGMDHFTRCLALDEALKPNGAKVCSLAPGVIDTDMQIQLRSSNKLNFPEQQAFIDLKVRNQLASASEAAARVLTYLARPDFGTNPVGDVRD